MSASASASACACVCVCVCVCVNFSLCNAQATKMSLCTVGAAPVLKACFCLELVEVSATVLRGRPVSALN